MFQIQRKTASLNPSTHDRLTSPDYCAQCHNNSQWIAPQLCVHLMPLLLLPDSQNTRRPNAWCVWFVIDVFLCNDKNVTSQRELILPACRTSHSLYVFSARGVNTYIWWVLSPSHRRHRWARQIHFEHNLIPNQVHRTSTDVSEGIHERKKQGTEMGQIRLLR